MTSLQSFLIAVEDELSGAVMEKLISSLRRNSFLRIINAHGNGRLKTGMSKYRNASCVMPHIILTDLDGYSCPLALLEDWGARNLPHNLLVRIAIREIESWLLADRQGISNFLDVDISKVPNYPELEDNPKRTLINLARKSRKRRLSIEIVPAKKSAASIGPLYNFHFINFVQEFWDIDNACENSGSLARTVSRISSLLEVT